jgi:hypothetical protein
MPKEQCPGCGEWFEHTDLEAHLPTHGKPEVIARASVRDPIFPEVTKPEPALSTEARNLTIGVISGLALLFVYVLGIITYITNLSVEQFHQSSQLVVQLDSFLTGGWVIGFFYYWGAWEKALRKSKRARVALRRKPKDAIQFKSTERVKFYYRMFSRERNLTPDTKLFFGLVLGVVLFILSGVAAVFSVLTYAVIAVQLELTLMMGGVFIMVLSWVFLRYVTYKLRAQTDEALELE